MGGKCEPSDATGSACGRVGGQRNVALDITVSARSGMEECPLKRAGLRIQFP
jgi:hypothetical protein